MSSRTKLRQLVAVTIISIFGWVTFSMTLRVKEIPTLPLTSLERQQRKLSADAEVGGILIKKLMAENKEHHEVDLRIVRPVEIPSNIINDTVMRTVAFKPFLINNANNQTEAPTTTTTSTTPKTTEDTTVSQKQIVSKFHNVCIEFDNNMQPGQMPMPGHRRLVVYNASSVKEEHLQVGLFDIHILPAEMPKGRQFIDQFFAYFIPLTDSVNDTSNKNGIEQKLKNLMEHTPEVNTRGRNQVYLAVGERCPGDDKLWCIKHGKFYDTAQDDELSLILLKSSFHPNFIYFTQAPTGVCYASVFVAHSVQTFSGKSGVQGAIGNAHPVNLT